MDQQQFTLSHSNEAQWSRVGKTYFTFALSVIALLYLLQLATPLRINSDAISYFLIAASVSDGHGFLLHGHKPHFPPGYPAILSMLERAGWGNSPAVVGWNYLMLAIAVAAGIWLLRRWLRLSTSLALLVAVVFLLSVCTIRYSTIPGSEPTYLAMSMLCLVCLTAAELAPVQRTSLAILLWLAGAALSSAVLVRTIGVTLWPAVAWSAILIAWRRRRNSLSPRQWVAQHHKKIAAAVLLGLLADAVLLWVLRRNPYVHEALNVARAQGWRSAARFILRSRAVEAGSILFNIWTHDNQHIFHLLAILGIAALPLILLLVARRLRRPGSADIYLLAYVCVLMIWPYKPDNRFWLPVQILIYGILARELFDLASTPPRARLIATVTALWLAFFAMSGALALGRSTSITYAGRQFSERYDLPWARDTYRLALNNGLPVNPQNVNQDMLMVLHRYGARDFSAGRIPAAHRPNR